jgi:hypothetical protein
MTRAVHSPFRDALLRQAVGALAGKPEPADAAKIAAVAAARVLEPEQDKEFTEYDSLARAQAIAALVASLDPDVVALALPRYLKTMRPRQNDSDGSERALIEATATALAGRLRPEQAGPAVLQTFDGRESTRDLFELNLRMKVVARLAERMKPGDALAVAQRILGAWTAERSSGPIQAFSIRFGGNNLASTTDGMAALAALVPRLQPADASAIVKSVIEHAIEFRVLLQGWDKELGSFHKSIASLAAAMTSQDVAATMKSIVAGIGKLEGERTPPLTAPPVIVAALAARMDPAAASVEIQRALRAIAQPAYNADLQRLGDVVLELAGRLPLAPVLETTIDTMAQTRNPWAIAPLVRVAAPLIAKLPTPELVNLLKQPSTVGAASQAVLTELGKRENHHFVDLWDAATWVHDHYPTLPLATPPQRVPKLPEL